LNTLAAKSSSVQYLRVSKDVLWQRLDDEVIVMQLRTDQIYSLNYTGARFWELLVSGKDVLSICGELENEFGVSSGTLAAEIDETLAFLISEKLLSPTEL
jgi:hypothetical protein